MANKEVAEILSLLASFYIEAIRILPFFFFKVANDDDDDDDNYCERFHCD